MTDTEEIISISTTTEAMKEIPVDVIEAGERLVNVGYRIVLRDVCEFNDIEPGDIVTIYIKKTNKKGKKRN